MVRYETQPYTWGDPSAARSLLFHGVTSNAASWARVQGGAGRQNFYVVAPELRAGHGDSPKADRRYALELMVGDLAERAARADAAGRPLVRRRDGYSGHQRGILQPHYLALEDQCCTSPTSRPRPRAARRRGQSAARSGGHAARQPKWLPIDAEGKVASLRAIDHKPMRQVFADNAPWDLRADVAARWRRTWRFDHA
ncbi:MAG: hypothetical protein U0Z44_13270 [Kouleothrix sp.]